MSNITADNKLLPSIYSLFQDVQEESGEVNRQELAQKVFDSIKEEDYGHYLRQALGRLVHTDINQMSRSLSNSIQSIQKEIAELPETTSKATKQGKGKILATVQTDSISSKRDELSLRRTAKFNMPERAADGRPIRLGASTYDDLVFQAERLILHGESAIADGKERQKWAQALEKNGVKTLEELPEKVLTSLGL